jgi:hypothetical protein
MMTRSGRPAYDDNPGVPVRPRARPMRIRVVSASVMRIPKFTRLPFGKLSFAVLNLARRESSTSPNLSDAIGKSSNRVSL